MESAGPSTSFAKSNSEKNDGAKSPEASKNSRQSASQEGGKDKPVYRGPEGNKIFSEESLKRLKIHIYTNVKKKQLKTEIVNPEEIKPVRRPNEGKAPIFSKIPIEEVNLKDEILENVKKTLDKTKSSSTAGESSRESRRKRESGSPSKDRDRKAQSSERRSHGKRSRSKDGSRGSSSSSSGSDHKSRRRRRRRSRSDDSSSDSRSSRSRSRSRERRSRSRSHSRHVRRSNSRGRHRSRERRIVIRRPGSAPYNQGPSGPRDPRLSLRNPRPNFQQRWRQPMVPFYPPPVFFGPPGPFRGPGPPPPGFPPRFFPPY